MTPFLEARALRKVYMGGDGLPLEVLHRVDLGVERGEIVAVIGASGVGKSTLLHLLGALDRPTGGDVLLEGRGYSTLSEGERDALRNRAIGFVFQFHHLLRDFTALENVMMPLLIRGTPPSVARERARQILEVVRLGDRAHHRPAQLSGGEQQRCAVARAVVHDPKLLLADEPSGNLDHYHGEQLHQLLIGLVRQLEMTLVVVTHNRELAERADRVLRLQDGVLHAVASSEVMP